METLFQRSPKSFGSACLLICWKDLHLRTLTTVLQGLIHKKRNSVWIVFVVEKARLAKIFHLQVKAFFTVLYMS